FRNIKMFNCQLCQENNEETISGGSDSKQQKLHQFSNISELEAHLSSEHFNCLPYECEQCHFAKFPTEFAVIKHNEEDHGNKCYSFRCRITPSLKQKRAQLRAYLLKIKKQQQNLSSLPNNDVNNSLNLKDNTNEKCETNEEKNEYSEEVNERNKLKPLSKELNKKKLNLNNGLSSINDSGNEDFEYFDDDLTVSNNSSLTEQLQAACAQNIRHRRAENEKNKKTSPTYGGTVKIKEGEELPTNILLGNNCLTSTGNTTDEENEELEEMDEFEESEMNILCEDELLEEEEELNNGEQIRKQEADVQEILKAAAIATSQVGGVDTAVIRNNSKHYSLRPNRFTPYAALIGGKTQQQQQSTATPLRQQKRQNWQINLGNSSFGNNGSSNNLSLLMNRRERIVERIRCRKCGELVNSTGGCLMHHLNTRHLRLPLFKCRECNKDFYEVSNTRIHKHMRIYHNGDKSNLISNYSKYSHQLHEGRDKCFGTRDERLREIQRERGTKGGLCTNLNLDRNIDISSFIPNINGKTNNINSKINSRIIPSSSQHFVNNKKDEFLYPTINSKQNGNTFKQQEKKIPCKVCGEMVLNKLLNKHNHVNTRHLHLPLHQCRLCQKSFTSYSRSACYSHVQFAHRADLDSGLFSQNIEEHIIYMKEQFKNQLEEAVNDYFD
ncbi:C2H2-type domain-containing protein, partial [Meloidogyne graminicola]